MLSFRTFPVHVHIGLTFVHSEFLDEVVISDLDPVHVHVGLTFVRSEFLDEVVVSGTNIGVRAMGAAGAAARQFRKNSGKTPEIRAKHPKFGQHF